MIKNSLVKKFFKGKGVRVSKEALNMLDREITKFLEKASEKALTDKRKTLQPEDVVIVKE